MSRTRFYRIWESMRNRCNNSRSTNYKYYGGRGIKHDPRWSDFEVFLREMYGGYEEHLTIESIDVNGNYEKSNCKWVTRKDQVRNTRRALLYPFNGSVRPLAEIAENVWVKYSVLKRRLVSYGWSLDKAISCPVYKGKLSSKQREEIRSLLSADPHLNKTKLAESYGVSPALISLIQKHGNT